MIWSELDRHGLEWHGLAWNCMGWHALERRGVDWNGRFFVYPWHDGTRTDRHNPHCGSTASTRRGHEFEPRHKQDRANYMQRNASNGKGGHTRQTQIVGLPVSPKLCFPTTPTPQSRPPTYTTQQTHHTHRPNHPNQIPHPTSPAHGIPIRVITIHANPLLSNPIHPSPSQSVPFLCISVRSNPCHSMPFQPMPF